MLYKKDYVEYLEEFLTGPKQTREIKMHLHKNIYIETKNNYKRGMLKERKNVKPYQTFGRKKRRTKVKQSYGIMNQTTKYIIQNTVNSYTTKSSIDIGKFARTVSV